jgi:hypothetical protein
VVASPITYLGMIATFKRAQLGKRLTQEEFGNHTASIEEQWKNTQIINLAGQSAKDYALRGCDAFQFS